MDQTLVVAVAITNAVFQTVKQIDSNDKFNKFYPLAVLVLGFVVGFLFHLGVVASLIVGVTANGTYAVAKPVVKVGVEMVKGMLD